jgi:hypothetical protein
MRWTKDEDQILREKFQTAQKDELMLLLPNRSWNSILNRGNRTFKLSRSNFKHGFAAGNTFRKDKTPWNKGIPFFALRGEKNPKYKGYSYITKRGYRYIKVSEDTDTWTSYRPEHIAVLENFLGRKIIRTKNGKGEGVHHIDGNKLNNEIDNLLLYSNEKEHRLIHNQLETLTFELVQKGIIKFDKITKKYYYNE